MLRTVHTLSRRPGVFVRLFSDRQTIFDRGTPPFRGTDNIDAVVHHRDVLAKRKDMEDYAYLRNDVLDQLIERTDVVAVCRRSRIR